MGPNIDGGESLAINKKAVFFTLTAILLVSLFIIFPSLYQFKEITQRTATAEQRIYAVNNYIKNLERDIERGLYISSYRAIYALIESISSSGEFLNDTYSSFNSALMNGTINNKSYIVMQDSTLSAWVTKVELEGTKLHVTTYININNVNLYQKNPWYVTVGVNISINVSDPSKTAVWNRRSYIETDIGIIGFEDPLYVKYGLGRLTNLINQSPYDENFTVATNTTNLLNHVENSYYVTSDLSPSYLMRFEGNLSNSSNGIESMINLPKFTAQGITVQTRSVVDSVYWSTANPTIYRINNTPSWFRVDQEHLNRYNLSDMVLP